MTLSACFSKTPRLISWTLDPERHSPNSPGPLVTVGRAAAGWSGIGWEELAPAGRRTGGAPMPGPAPLCIAQSEVLHSVGAYARS
jgi:hypothetical protein